MGHEAGTDYLRLYGQAAARLSLDTLPVEVVRRAKQRVLDTLGCLIGGYRAGISDEIRSYVAAQGGTPEATLLPGGGKTSASLAAFAHASYIFGLELSDAAPRGTVHPGCEIVPATLAVAETRSLGGAAIIPALVAGYEIEIRIARSVHPSAYYRGWKPPGVFGGIGSAVAAAHMFGLGAEGIDNAIGISLNLAPATTGRTSNASTVKWVMGGQACASGLLAAEMASRGIKGMRDIVGNWLAVLSDKVQPEQLVEGINPEGNITDWELIIGIVTKYHATVGPLVSSLEATFSLLEQHDIQTGDVEEIHVDCMHRTAIFNKVHPDSGVSARGSLPYCLAIAVCTRDQGQLLGPAYQPDMLANKDVWAMAERVRITENEDYERQYPARSLARVTIRLKSGASHSLEVDRSQIGRYLNPTDTDIENKFRSLSTPVLGQAKTDKIVSLVWNLEKLAKVTELVEALRPA